MGLSADASVSKDVVILSHRRPMASLRKWIQATYPVGGLAGTQSPGSVSGPRRRFGTRYRVPGARYPVPGTSTPFPLSCRIAELPYCRTALLPNCRIALLPGCPIALDRTLVRDITPSRARGRRIGDRGA
jgi:hypothetical protein